MQLSAVLVDLAQYPFTRLDEWKADARARGIELIDFGMGDPREVTPPFIREALVDGLTEVSSYPRATGLPELRDAIAGWIGRRFDVDVDPAAEIVPTLGSKEAIFSFAQIAVGERRLVAIPEPAYPVYERGALFAGAEVVTVPLTEESGWLPDLDTFAAWDELALFWTCYPNNPTGAVRRSRFTRSSPSARASTASSSARTRRTRSCGSTIRRSRRCRWRCARTSSSSTRSRSGRR